MRLFIAFNVSQEAEEELSRAVKKLNRADIRLASEFHLTLKFLGEVGEGKIEEVKKRVGGVEFESFESWLDSIGVFPSENHIRVVWAGAEPKDRISALQQKIDESLEGMFPRESRFHPHITLARVKRVHDKQKFRELLKEISIKRVKTSVRGFKLVKSELTRQGPEYAVLEEFPAKDL